MIIENIPNKVSFRISKYIINKAITGIIENILNSDLWGSVKIS